MPQFEHLDRCMIEAEQTLWIAKEALSMIEHSGAFRDRIGSIIASLETLAREMRDYNDQFEE
jgi:hypothetical protein